ncbi:MAG: cold shock domain-containing protein [Treponema sp.]|nr:cold shock domain-containing protein [Treponema sp.]
MEGVIIKYKDDKGYGFIKDENERERFFHISDVQEQYKFKEMFHEYFYLNEYYDDGKTKIVDFTPHDATKGPAALKIFLSIKTINDKYCSDAFECFVKDIDYNVWGVSSIVQGIRQCQRIPFGATAGGFGTYRTGYPEMHRDLKLKFRKIGGIGWGEIEIRNLALNLNGRSKITTSFVENLNNKLKNQKIKIFGNNGYWKLEDENILIV